MAFHSRERAEEIEIEAAENWKKARAGFKSLALTLKIIGATVALSFAYFAGEKAGVEICSTYRESGL